MTQLALYRKYRPSSFDELVGQDEVVRTLKGAIEKNMLHHAYLFYGPRGVGKTSVARIFAKELGVSDKDLYELDAASKRKIEDFRELSESVKSLPFESQYKVYIIDEVHMLTQEAFNAFLKTLEEPPEYVIFILATTEFERVPDTIKSRCSVLNFKPASSEDISKVLSGALQKEGLSIEAEALNAISLLADGSFRDAFGILQKVISSLPKSSGKISLKDVERSQSFAPISHAFELLLALSQENKKRAIEILADIKDTNADFKVFTYLLSDILSELLAFRFAKEEYLSKLQNKYGEERMIFFEKMANAHRLNSQTIISLIEKLELYPYMNNKSLILDLFVYEFFEKAQGNVK